MAFIKKEKEVFNEAIEKELLLNKVKGVSPSQALDAFEVLVDRLIELEVKLNKLS